MRLAFVSDLHFDLPIKAPPRQYFDIFSKLVKAKGIDILVLGGDISDFYTLTISFVEMLQKRLEIPVYFIPGNHDFYSEQKHKDTWDIYDEFKEHPQCLIESPLKLTDEYTLVGHTAWFNFSFHNETANNYYSQEGLTPEGLVYKEKEYTNWNMTDIELSKYFSKIIEKDFQLNYSPHYILVTHVMNHAVFAKDIDEDPHVEPRFIPFAATNDLDKIFESYSIPYSIQGHYHIRQRVQQGDTLFVSCALGRPEEWKSNNISKELEEAVFILDI
ncbi:metallophosphoesterase [Fundicoccus culcitae]|uniref:Metallophosphoesterase n=1 Tax=Fundicoccus culcitae TaxID=2969821 RepID=A0ABY5P510_9LACT|nr:metallophosphoesterase [Fundicoccus culcitae]UUX33465.1 metallophosphoesterase [Fundicoccus culcitae]